MENTMSTKEAVNILKQFNAWRLSESEYYPGGIKIQEAFETIFKLDKNE